MIARGGSYRASQRALMSAQRLEARLVVIPDLAPSFAKKRAELEKDTQAWLRWFYPHVFYYGFTLQQQAMIRALDRAFLVGGDQAIAASRGEGKTSLVEGVDLKYTVQGLCGFSVLFGANGSKAEQSIYAIRSALEGTGDFEGTESAARFLRYYPEVVAPIRDVAFATQRAHSQVVARKLKREKDKRKWKGSTVLKVGGQWFEVFQNKFSWGATKLVFPNIPGSPSKGAAIYAYGLDVPVRGIKHGVKRPRVVIIDDPDTEDTIRNPVQQEKLRERIDSQIAYLGSQTKKVARVLLTTLQRTHSASAKYTDPKVYPGFRGRRFAFLLSPPKRTDLWEEYVAEYRYCLARTDEDGEPVDPWARGAHALYVRNRREMDEGAEVANPHRFDGTVLDDGSRRELSALQHYYNFVAEHVNGIRGARAELDNDPMDDEDLETSDITAGRIQRKLSGMARRQVPEHCAAITQGIDVGKWRLHWVVRAWDPGDPDEHRPASFFTVDYGTDRTAGATLSSDEGLDLVVQDALARRFEAFTRTHYVTRDGEICEAPRLTLVDARFRTDDVYAVCNSVGGGLLPVMGIGASVFGSGRLFRPLQEKTPTHRPGDGYNEVRRGQLWLIEADTDRWKAWEHDRWLTAIGGNGSMYLWGDPHEDATRLSRDQRDHQEYADHICAEKECEEQVKGAAVRRVWVAVAKENHYLDASYYSTVAARMLDVAHVGAPSAGRKRKRIPGQRRGPRKTLQQMASG